VVKLNVRSMTRIARLISNALGAGAFSHCTFRDAGPNCTGSSPDLHVEGVAVDRPVTNCQKIVTQPDTARGASSTRYFIRTEYLARSDRATRGASPLFGLAVEALPPPARIAESFCSCFWPAWHTRCSVPLICRPMRAGAEPSGYSNFARLLT